MLGVAMLLFERGGRVKRSNAMRDKGRLRIGSEA